MSLVGLAIRIALTQAIRGRTIAEDRVYDSAIETLDQMAKGEARPLVIVSVDDAEGGSMGDCASLMAADRMNILIELASAGPVEIEGEDGAEADTQVATESTSQASEMTLDVLWRQISRVLLTPVGDPWADLWRSLCTVTAVELKRGGSADAGVRFASRFYLVTVNPMADPDFGVAPSAVWRDLIEALDAAGLSGVAEIIRAEITDPDGLADWRQIQARLGIATEAVTGLGITPPYDGDPEDPDPIASYDTGTGPIDADRAEEIDGPAEG